MQCPQRDAEHWTRSGTAPHAANVYRPVSTMRLWNTDNGKDLPARPVHRFPDRNMRQRGSMASPHVAFGMAIVGEFPAQKGLGLVIATRVEQLYPERRFRGMFIIPILALTQRA